MTPKVCIFLLVILSAITVFQRAASADPDAAEVRIEGTSLAIVLEDGRELIGPDLVGFTLSVVDERGGVIEIRIDGAQPGRAGRGVHWLFDLKTPNTAGEWDSYCKPGPDGLQLGFPVAGWTDTMGMFHPSDQAMTFNCTGGALAKCFRLGYAPWRRGKMNAPMLDRFRACTRMIRADYCGTGRTQTKIGTRINVYDTRSLHRAGASPDLLFEAAWGADGAVCVARTRWADLMTLGQLQSACGAKLAGKIGQPCTSDTAHQLPGKLIFNESEASK